MTLADLKSAIDRSGLPDDAPVFVNDALNPLAVARADWLIVAPGLAITCGNEADQAKVLERERERKKGWSEAEAIRGLILISQEEADEREEWGNEGDEDDEGE